jgi:hypothetical protein
LAPLRLAGGVDDGQRATELAQRVCFAGMLVAFPVRGVATDAFLKVVRSRDSRCRRSGIVLLCSEELRKAAEEHLGAGANRVVTIEEAERRLRPVFDILLAVAPRAYLRLPARVEISPGGMPKRLFCQTANVSVSGMLLRGEVGLGPGDEVGFELLFPSDRRPLAGRGFVVRTTGPRDVFPGVGVRFAKFAGNDYERLSHHLCDVGAGTTM